MKSILVTCYKSPDLDGTACIIGYTEFLNKNGEKTQAGIYENPSIEARFILDFLDLPVPRQDLPFDKVILMDASTITGLPKNFSPNQVIEIVDHRKNTELEKFPNLEKVLIELVGAAATLVAEKYMNTNTPISRESATLLHQAIISNTLNFKANVTTKRDRKAAKYLKSQTKIPSNLTHKMFMIKSDMTGEKLSQNIKGDLSRQVIGGCNYLICQLEMIGVEKLINTRKKEILDIISGIKHERNLDNSFISLIDLEKGNNVFVCSEKNTQKILEGSLGIKFDKDIAKRDGLIMRKEIIPIMKNFVEH
jgi:inorganic pyrophosphatase/exopolyphosphatase